MRFPARQRTEPLPGLTATARVERRTRALMPRLRPGDIAVLDHLDMDRATAQALVDAGVSAVVNVGPFISGRYPNLGPELLVHAGVELVDGIGDQGLVAIKDGARIRVHDGTIFVDEEAVAWGRALDLDQVVRDMGAAREALPRQLESFTHNATEFLRREQELLLHGIGAPRLSTRIAGRPVVVVVRGHEYAEELRGISRFIREQDPVLIAVDRAADALRDAGHDPDVVVLTGGRRGDEMELASARAVKAARDVVVLADRGASRATDQLERLGVSPLRFATGATAEDAALLLADLGHARLIVGVGMHATLDEFLDRQRAGLASTYLTRLRVGPRLVDAAAVPELYSGRVQPWHVVLVLLAGLVALATAIGVTPVGQEWTQQFADQLAGLRSGADSVPLPVPVSRIF